MNAHLKAPNRREAQVEAYLCAAVNSKRVAQQTARTAVTAEWPNETVGHPKRDLVLGRRSAVRRLSNVKSGSLSLSAASSSSCAKTVAVTTTVPTVRTRAIIAKRFTGAPLSLVAGGTDRDPAADDQNLAFVRKGAPEKGILRPTMSGNPAIL
jgi:hypothetical protein